MSEKRLNHLWAKRRLAAALTILLLLSQAFVQGAAGQKRPAAFRTVPAQFRPQLIERLRLYVRYRSTRQWGRLYDLYSKQHIARRWPMGLSRAEFIAGNEEDEKIGTGSNLLSFRADKVQFSAATGDAPARVWIYGCATYYTTQSGRRVGPSRRLKSVIEATHENGQWLMTDVVINYRCEECAPDKC